MWSKPTTRWLWIAAVALLFASHAMPCGPYTPARVLLLDDERAVLSLPTADFLREVNRLLPEDDPAFRVEPPNDETPFDQSARLGRDDLAAALSDAGFHGETHAALLKRYDEIRQALSQLDERNRRARELGVAPAEVGGPAIPLPDPPNQYPAEFGLYLEGLSAYHLGEPNVADRFFRELLDLPEDQRRYRSVWAAYMLGKTHLRDDPDTAVRWFEQTRRLAAAGFTDPLGLASSSYGWQGRAHLNAAQPDRALALYFNFWHSGDYHGLVSMRAAANALVEAEGEPLRRAAGDALLQRLVTAYLLSEGWLESNALRPDDAKASRAWLAAVEQANPDPAAQSTPGADRLAWLAYRRNEIDAAARWAQQAADTPIAVWVRAKLALRAGEVDRGVELLAAAARAFPVDEGWYAHHPAGDNYDQIKPRRLAGGELAVLQLARSQYTDALTLFIRHGYADEAYYLAEHVLSIEEVQAYIASDQYDPEVEIQPAFRPFAADALPLEGLLANRLTRAGRWQEAAPLYDEARRETLMDYISAIRAANNQRESADARAEHYWLAATLALTDAAPLLAFYAEPPHHVEKRNWMEPRYAQKRPQREPAELSAMSDDERKRLTDHAEEFARDRHAAFTAAAHAWHACALMPNDDDRTAYRLTIAGNWIMYRDPEAADRFYKALVTRCANTELGKRAAERRWFPKLTDDPLYLTK